MQHHAFVIEAGADEGIETALQWTERELGMHRKQNPDVVVARYSVLSVEDARRVTERASGAPFAGEHKVIIIAANRAYHEAQNALLKIFEEPPPGTFLFLVLPTLGGLLPTLHSRVQVLSSNEGPTRSLIPKATEEFIKASEEKRSALIKRLAGGTNEEERRENREKVIELVNDMESIAYAHLKKHNEDPRGLLDDIATLRAHLHDRSAPVRQILEHLSIILPKSLRTYKQI